MSRFWLDYYPHSVTGTFIVSGNGIASTDPSAPDWAQMTGSREEWSRIECRNAARERRRKRARLAPRGAGRTWLLDAARVEDAAGGPPVGGAFARHMGEKR